MVHVLVFEGSRQGTNTTDHASICGTPWFLMGCKASTHPMIGQTEVLQRAGAHQSVSGIMRTVSKDWRVWGVSGT